MLLMLVVNLAFSILLSDGIEIPLAWKKLIAEACEKFEYFSPGLAPCVVEARQIKRFGTEEGIELYFCPKIMLWDPILSIFVDKELPLLCPEHYEQLTPTNQWMDGSSTSRNPRLLLDTSCVMILVAREYECPGSICDKAHRVRTTDARLLQRVADEFEEVLFSRKFCMRRTFLSMMIDSLLSGVSFGNLHLNMMQRMQDFIQESIHKLEIFLKKRERLVNESKLQTTIPSLEALLFSMVPNDETLKRIFNEWCELNRHQLEASVFTKDATALMVDHTFKVTFNIGMHRETDGKWSKMFNSLFIAMNEEKEVVTWKLTKAEKFGDIEEILKLLRDRLPRFTNDQGLHFFVSDTCCKWERHVRSLFGPEIEIKLDLFHAIQRITSTMNKRNPHFKSFSEDLRGIFRSKGDSGLQRTLNTPISEEIAENLKKLMEKWKSVESLLMGNPLINQETRKAVTNLLKHVNKGCLSDIPPRYSTSMNENLHKQLNRILKGLKMGPELAANLLMIFFFVWNSKTAMSKCGKKVYSSIFQPIRPEKRASSKSNKDCSGETTANEAQLQLFTTLPKLDFQSQHVSSFLTRYHLCKRLKARCRIESIPFEMFFDTSRFYGLLSRTSGNADAPSVLEKRSSNFGLQCVATVPFPRDRKDHLFSVLAVSIANIFADNESLGHLKKNLEEVGISENISSNAKWLQDRMDGLKIDTYCADAAKVIQALTNIMKVPTVCLLPCEALPFVPFYPVTNLENSSPLYLAFLQGHWRRVEKALSFTTPECKNKKTAKKKRMTCCCGLKDKNPGKKCTKIDGMKYTSKCPCLKEKRSCEACECKGCENPMGQPMPRKLYKAGSPRKRAPSQLQPNFKKSKEFLLEKGVDTSATTWSMDESFLLRYCMEIAPEDNIKQGDNFSLMARQLSRLGFNIGAKSSRQIRAKGEHLRASTREVTARMVVSSLE